ncbi:MAG TPA: carboxypeptidase regulatory-like domain-containing protein [Pirellulaceae bacterium]|nr:carboxypeptidase regulatory-like domain-containing protein [Pirellulaceae bacterium]
MKSFLALAVTGGLLILAGCDNGPKLGEVSGKVTLDGQPIKGLEVSFVPTVAALGTTAIGYTQADGTYTLHYPGDRQGAPVGEYKVSIAGGETDGESGAAVQIPAKYNQQSELTVEVKSGKNTHDFVLTSK